MQINFFYIIIEKFSNNNKKFLKIIKFTYLSTLIRYLSDPLQI